MSTIFGKNHYFLIETIDSDPMDAVGSIGVSKWQLIRYVVLPESAPHLLGQMLYMFDYNVRQSSILGIGNCTNYRLGKCKN